jgi:hypothetical protein
MKNSLRTILFIAALVPAAAFAQAGIRNTDHDLSNSSTNTAIKNGNAANNQICIYCHTPHKAQSTNLLWNHTATLATTWAWGTDLNGLALTNTYTGTPLPTTLRSGSKRCLGCHDGSVAIGDVSNAGDGAAGNIGGLTGAVAGLVDVNGFMIDPTHTIGAPVAAGVGSMGTNHPISIPYAGQVGYNGATSSVPAAWMGGAVGGYFDVVTAGCTSTTGVCTAAPATDGRDGAAINLIPNVVGGTTNVGVECATCHEPHNKYGFGWFTRVDVTNASGLCRSCHNK